MVNRDEAGSADGSKNEIRHAASVAEALSIAEELDYPVQIDAIPAYGPAFSRRVYNGEILRATVEDYLRCSALPRTVTLSRFAPPPAVPVTVPFGRARGPAREASAPAAFQLRRVS